MKQNLQQFIVGTVGYGSIEIPNYNLASTNFVVIAMAVTGRLTVCTLSQLTP